VRGGARLWEVSASNWEQAEMVRTVNRLFETSGSNLSLLSVPERKSGLTFFASLKWV
jgi:hypothetical protein